MKISLIALLIILWSNVLVSGQGLQVPGPQNSTAIQKEEEIRSEISKLMQNFASLGFTREEEEKYMEVMQEIAEKFGMKAVPFILEGMKDENERIRYYSLSTISIIIGDFRKKQKFSKEIDMTTFSFPADEKGMIEEIFSNSLKATEDPVSEIRHGAFYTLGILRPQKALPVFKKGIKDRDIGVRFFACMALKNMGFQEYNILEVLSGKKLQNPEDYVQFLGIDEYGMYIFAEKELKNFRKKAIPVLLKVASSEKEPDRMRAIQVLAEMKTEEAIPTLTNYLKRETDTDTTLRVQIYSASVLNEIGTPESIAALEQYGLKHKNVEIKFWTAQLLISKKKEAVILVLNDLASDKNPEIRYQVAELLIENKEKSGIPILIGLLKERKYLGPVRTSLVVATGQRLGGFPPVVSKEFVEKYINKWQDWWEKNKETFKFPEKQVQ